MRTLSSYMTRIIIVVHVRSRTGAGAAAGVTLAFVSGIAVLVLGLLVPLMVVLSATVVGCWNEGAPVLLWVAVVEAR